MVEVVIEVLKMVEQVWLEVLVEKVLVLMVVEVLKGGFVKLWVMNQWIAVLLKKMMSQFEVVQQKG